MGGDSVMITLSYQFDGREYPVSRDDIVSAMKRFDEQVDHASERRPLTRRGSKYFVWWHRKSYPPKQLLRLLPHPVVGRFSGGNATNQVFRDLEFYVGKGRYPKRLADSSTALVSASALKRRLLAQRWNPLTRNFLKGKTGQYPGVYLFAWSDQHLEGKRIVLEDIFYVGSSCTGLNPRLNQFCDGIHRNCCHSAAIRFHTRWYRRSRRGYRFFVATVSVPCETRKELRTEKDLRKMGRVAELEYDMLAEIKKCTGFEPLLNRK